MFYAPPQKVGGGTRNRKVAPATLPSKWGGDFLKYPGDDKMGQFLGHFCIYEGSKSQNLSRATRAKAYRHGYMLFKQISTPTMDNNGYMQGNSRFWGYFGIWPENPTRNRKFWGGAPPPFRQTPYKTLSCSSCKDPSTPKKCDYTLVLLLSAHKVHQQ